MLSRERHFRWSALIRADACVSFGPSRQGGCDTDQRAPPGNWEKDVPMLLLQHLLRQLQPAVPLSSLPNVEVTGVTEGT